MNKDETLGSILEELIHDLTTPDSKYKRINTEFNGKRISAYKVKEIVRIDIK